MQYNTSKRTSSTVQCSVGTGSVLVMTHGLNLTLDISAVALIVCLLYSGRKKKGEVRHKEGNQEVKGPQTSRQALLEGFERQIWSLEDPFDHTETDSEPQGWSSFPIQGKLIGGSSHSILSHMSPGSCSHWHRLFPGINTAPAESVFPCTRSV